MTFDEARAAYPAMQFAAYAFDPGGSVTLETIVDGQSFTFTGPTLQAALDRAFPPAPEPEPINAFE
jgi:hypothetical protein